MKWEKVGQIFCADNDSEMMVGYGRMPTPMHLKDDVFRIYFESRTKENIAHPYFVDIDLNEPTKIIQKNTSPLLKCGEVGTFDDNGITPFTIIKHSPSKIWMYYAGWTRQLKVPFHNAIGLAESNDGGATFKKVFSGPILERDKYDPYFPTGPAVIKVAGVYYMWYTSFEKWEENNSEMKHFYNIKMRTSLDGINWNSEPRVAIDFENEHEYAFVCRSVLHINGKFMMWYSFRAQQGIDTYRVGYAESNDGVEWVRKDHLSGINVALEGWDSDMICYPCVFSHKSKLYMLYNGNGYGQTGYGLAVMAEG